MKVTCNVIRDILPLYAENMLSDDSCAMVIEHIEQCQECKVYLDELKTFYKIPVDTNFSPLLKIKSTLRKKKIQTAILSMMLSVMILVITIAFLTAPEYNPYSAESVKINGLSNGSVIAIFEDIVSGYDISSYPNDDNTGYVYHITTWDNIWNRTIKRTRVNNTILNPNNENVAAVYYYQTDRSEDILIYGKDINPNGGIVTLPRLFLTYYAFIALILVAVCGFFMALFRRHKKAFNLTMKILFLPVSYLLGHLMIKGVSTTSYTATRDFYAILLVMIPLYIVFITAIRFIKENNKRKI